MTTSPKRTQRPQNLLRQAGIPAGFEAIGQDRFRWKPSPARRSAGWKQTPLKDPAGRYLSRVEAIALAQRIADACEAWANHQPVPPEFHHLAPTGAQSDGPLVEGPRSLGRLLDDYYTHCQEFLDNGAETQRGYRSLIDNFIRDAAGVGDDDTPDERKVKVARYRCLDLNGLFGRPPGQDSDFVKDPKQVETELGRLYRQIRAERGHTTAYNTMSALSAWFAYCGERRLWNRNPVKDVKRTKPKGRVVIWTFAELRHVVATAEALGYPSVADAIILSLDLTWNRQDVLSLTWDQVKTTMEPDAKTRELHAVTRINHARIKTGNRANPPLLPIGVQRLEQIRERQADLGIQSPYLVHCEQAAEPASGRKRPDPDRWLCNSFSVIFGKIRDVAAQSMPSIAGKRFQDLRDTSVTYCFEAGLTIVETISRTAHSPERAEQILLDHYGSVTKDVADNAARKLTFHFEANGYHFDPTPPALVTTPGKPGDLSPTSGDFATRSSPNRPKAPLLTH